MAGNFEQPPVTRPVKVFNCPSCGAGVKIRAQGVSLAAVCEACKSVINVADENYRIISKFTEKIGDLTIPLGQRGKLHGVLWEVIGFLVRSESNGRYRWHEYLLFNPQKGFRWLTEFGGHWNYFVQTKEKPQVVPGGKPIAKALGKKYALFHRGRAKIDSVVGEFYWQVRVDEWTDNEDYIAPPEILSCEKNANEIVWSVGQYVSSTEVQAAFKVEKKMPIPLGVASSQVHSFAKDASFILRAWVVFAIVFVVIQTGSVFRSANQPILEASFAYRENDVEKEKISQSFELKQGVSNLEVELYSNVDNSWLEVDATLINDDTGATFDFNEGVEYYSGVDSDGAWNEGSRINSAVLSSIPAGNYHLSVQAAGHLVPGRTSGIDQEQAYTLALKRDVVNWSNFVWGLTLLSIYPAIVWWRRRSFEVARWSQSDYSPFSSHHDSSFDYGNIFDIFDVGD